MEGAVLMDEAFRASGGPEDSDGTDTGEVIAAETEELIAAHPWIGSVARLGWFAKGIVYVLMGMTALTIGTGRSTEDQASPTGAVGQLADTSWGRSLLLVLSVGLVLYGGWRLFSVALVRGGDSDAWGHRAGYLFSAVFYLVLAWTAFSAWRSRGDTHDDSIESMSSSLLGHGVGRVLVAVAGVAFVAIGVYFIVRKGWRRSFAKEIAWGKSTAVERKLVDVTGRFGWMGRGVVTALVGGFLVRAAMWPVPGEARGFDRAIREVAEHGAGRALIVVVAVGLVLYGLFCLVTVRLQKLGRLST